MEGNICARCLENVIGEEGIKNMTSVIAWNKKCKVCGDIAVFYARNDEIEKAINLLTPQRY